MNKYQDLDNLILARITRFAGSSFSELFQGPILSECERLNTLTNREPFRILDGRLTSLRNSKKAVYEKGFGWKIPE